MLHKQKGFTLLELLVVITLLALLSVGALVAYDGVGDNASSTAAANNMQTVDRTIRQYNAVTGKFPNQWDVLSKGNNSLAAFDGITGNPLSAGTFEEEELILPAAAREAFGGWAVTAANATAVKVLEVLADYGIDELQVVNPTVVGQLGGGVPNTAHNEGTNEEAFEVEEDDLGGVNFTALSILPTAGNCTAGTTTIAQNFNQSLDTTTVTGFDAQIAKINSINDFLEDRQCNLILALGFGGDAGKSMQNSSVQMTSSPTYASRNVNPARQYGRFVGLFHMGHAAEAADGSLPSGAQIDITAADIFEKPRLIAILTPEGKTLDEMLAEATKTVE